MGSLRAESDFKHDLNDSGYGQDDSITMKKQPSLENGARMRHLLDLSDDVLLYILKYCSPMDLKALGFTCSRLGALVLDHTLWERVDARAHPTGPERLKWYLKHALSAATTELLLSGYARQAEGCLGHMNCKYKEVERGDASTSMDSFGEGPSTSDPGGLNGTFDHTNRRGIIRGGPVIQIYDTMPRATCFPMPDAFGPDIGTEWAPPDNSCPGPQYTLTQSLLQELETHCPAITSLALEYCNIDCTTRNISHFPRTLKKLSLRGSKCYNQPLDKSFLFKIQDYLTELEELDVSECDWIEPSSLLPLSKLASLQRLYMRRCAKMTECVAYSSLATRYGFKTLKVIDLRESPVGDSEVSAFGWVGSLEELYVSPARAEAGGAARGATHAHYIGDVLPVHVELDEWEQQEPEYFKTKLLKPKYPDPSKVDLDNGHESNSLKRKMTDTSVVCSCRSRLESDEVAAKKPKSDVNDGASTSKWSPSTDPPPLRYFNSKSPEPGPSNAPDANGPAENGDGDGAQAGPSNAPEAPEADKPPPIIPEMPKYHRYIHFRQNEPPVIVDRPAGEDGRPDDRGSERPADRPERPDGNPRNPEPVHKILYVNVGRRLNTMYRLSMPVYAVAEPEMGAENARRHDGPFAAPRFHPASLISDTTVVRFGRADSDNINYINIGPHGVQYESHGSRPDRSNLRVLSMTGFWNITNRSLIHLATAAPMLRLVDFSGTRVTERGVENFRSHRPDCEVIFNAEKKEE